MTKQRTRFQYIEVSLEEIVNSFAKGFETKNGRILNAENFIDPFKKVVIFKLFIESQKEKA